MNTSDSPSVDSNSFQLGEALDSAYYTLSDALNALLDKYAHLPEAFHVSEGSGVKMVMDTLAGVIPSLTQLECTAFVMETNRFFSLFGLYELQRRMHDTHAIFDHRYAFPNRPDLSENARYVVAECANELIDIIVTALIGNHYYLNLNNPVGNVYRIGGYDQYCIHLYKNNPWSINHG